MSRYNNLKLLKHIPKSVEYCVFGYNRRTEKKSSIVIPLMIHNMCLLFYYQRDYFHSAHSDYQISKDNLTVTLTNTPSYLNEWEYVIFCNEWIPSISNKVIKWTFHINKLQSKECGIMFGLISKDKGLICNYDYFFGYRDEDGDDLAYVHYSAGSRSDGNHTLYAEEDEKEPWCFEQGDDIIYTFNSVNGTWKYQRMNGQNCKQCVIGNLEQKENVKYKMVIAMIQEGSSVTLKDYSWRFVNEKLNE